jgi:serine/threonine protein kinase
MPQLIETNTNEPRSPHRPRYRTIPALLEGLEPLFLTNIKELTIQIVGFGAAFFSEGECMKIPRRTAYPLESPEGLWRAKPVVGPSSDIWTLACTIYALLSSQELFGPPPMYPLQAMANIVRVLGDLPQELSVVWEKENLRDYVACLLEHEHAPLKRTTLAMRMEDLVTDPPSAGLTSREIVDLEFLLVEMLQYRPADRFSAAEVVRFLEQCRQQASP